MISRIIEINNTNYVKKPYNCQNINKLRFIKNIIDMRTKLNQLYFNWMLCAMEKVDKFSVVKHLFIYQIMLPSG